MSIQLIGGLLIILLGAVILFGIYWSDAPTPLYFLPLVIVFLGSVISTTAVINAIKFKAEEEANPTTEIVYQEIVVDNKRYVLAEDTIIIDGNTYVLTEDLNNTEE